MAGERLTEKEVEAIIKRYGESQTGAGQTSVEDVAEALQVEPAVVEKLLHEVRSAESSRQLQDRLAALERENSQLRSRASQWHDGVYGFEGWGFPMRHRRRTGMRVALIAMAVGVMIAAVTRAALPAGMLWAMVAIGIFMAMRFARR